MSLHFSLSTKVLFIHLCLMVYISIMFYSFFHIGIKSFVFNFNDNYFIYFCQCYKVTAYFHIFKLLLPKYRKSVVCTLKFYLPILLINSRSYLLCHLSFLERQSWYIISKKNVLFNLYFSMFINLFQ